MSFKYCLPPMVSLCCRQKESNNQPVRYQQDFGEGYHVRAAVLPLHIHTRLFHNIIDNICLLHDQYNKSVQINLYGGVFFNKKFICGIFIIYFFTFIWYNSKANLSVVSIGISQKSMLLLVSEFFCPSCKILPSYRYINNETTI